MMDWLLFGIFIFLMLTGVPLAVAMGLAGVVVVAVADLGMMSLPTNVYTGIAKYP
jgi:C4-dicarboxylate transporter, DctM subunit